jgi:hypothetical protein
MSADTNRLRLAMVAATLSALAACGGGQAELRQARDALAAALPAPYYEDLVTESVTIEGNRLVLVVRSPEGTAAKTRGHPRFDELRRSEQQQMQDLCGLPALRPLLASDAMLVRRFVDRFDDVFFETELPARECARAATMEATP